MRVIIGRELGQVEGRLGAEEARLLVDTGTHWWQGRGRGWRWSWGNLQLSCLETVKKKTVNWSIRRFIIALLRIQIIQKKLKDAALYRGDSSRCLFLVSKVIPSYLAWHTVPSQFAWITGKGNVITLDRTDLMWTIGLFWVRTLATFGYDQKISFILVGAWSSSGVLASSISVINKPLDV